jgi:transposase
VAIDTRTKKFCAAKIRVLPAHDSLDAGFLLRTTKPKIAVLDKGYSSESLYEQAYEQKTLLMIPQKKNAKRGFFRKKMHKKFRLRTYHRREMAESSISSLKRKYGASVSSRTVRTIRTDVYGRLACQNIFLWLKRLLGWSRANS